MIKPIDNLGFGPTRVVKPQSDGTFIIEVTPPRAFFKNPPTAIVRLTAEQYIGYQMWLDGMLIQDVLPSLSPVNREMLMTGLNDEHFHRAVEDDEDDGFVNPDDTEEQP
jgi:hypothetical protein